MYKQHKPSLTVVSHASNVCGLIAPVKGITEISHKYGGKVLIDGAQTLGLLPVDLKEINCDYYVFAGHKNLYGPIGVGGVIVNNENLLEPLIVGGTGSNSEELVMPYEYPGRLEAGSPNIVAIAGLNAGIKWLSKQENILEKERELLKTFLRVIGEYPEINVIGTKDTQRILPVVSCLFEGYTPQDIARLLDQSFNIAVRAGLHCAPKAHKILGTSLNGTIRISLGYFNSEKEILNFGNILDDIYY
jgi:selenocysteine lyase/cysteine desulfurase